MNIGHIKTTEFIDQIELLSKKTAEDVLVKYAGGEYNEKAYLEQIVKEARELLSYNEWLIALENTLDNLCEVEYKLQTEILDLASDALKAAANKSDRQELLNLLRK